VDAKRTALAILVGSALGCVIVAATLLLTFWVAS
jgi:hypothetical protein